MKKIKMVFPTRALSVLVGAFMMLEIVGCSVLKCHVYDTKVTNTVETFKVQSCMECEANKRAIKDSLQNYRYKVLKK